MKSFFSRRMRSCGRALRAPISLIAALALAVAIAIPIAAIAATAFLNGTVSADGKPVAGVKVTAIGNNVMTSTRTNAQGNFSFATLLSGTYTLEAADNNRTAQLRVDLPATGATVALVLAVKQLGSVTVNAARTSPVRSAGTDVTLNATLLARTPASGSFPELLIQLPGAARGANGVVHINGDHGDINYIVDGVSIPQELNRVIGTEFNPSDVAFIDVLEGAYPAQYGERFAAVLNIDTRTGVSAPPGASFEASGGSFGHIDSTAGYHDRIGSGSLVFAVRNERTDRGLDPPNQGSPHNQASNANQFLRYTVPFGTNFVNFTFSHAYRSFQIPIDINGGQPASSDDNETQDDLFSSVGLRHAIGDRGSLSFGLGYKQSHIRDFGDSLNDWTYGETLNLNNGGLATDCTNALTIPNYGPLTCAYSLASNRTATDYKANVDFALRGGQHEVRWGAVYDITNVAKLYAVTLQPGNFLAPIFTPGTPAASYSVIDNAPNDGNGEQVYLQDSWRWGSDYQFDYGVRFDAFTLRSTEFSREYSQFSPRVKLTRLLGPRASVYVYYGRFFTPFSFENVSPSAAQTINMPLQPTIAQFDLKPQRDSDYEIGGHLPLGNGDLGLRVMQKNATDLIDDTQVGVTLLHQDINYQQGRIATQSAYYQLPLARGGRVYVTMNHTYSVNKGCETQLLAPCFGSPTDWTPADHEQRWGATSGVIVNDQRGGWFSLDGEYGSGLSSAGCPPGTPGFCKFTPHITFDVEKGMAIGPAAAVIFRVKNLLNAQYRITYLNAQGNHYYAARAFEVGVRFGNQ